MNVALVTTSRKCKIGNVSLVLYNFTGDNENDNNSDDNKDKKKL